MTTNTAYALVDWKRNNKIALRNFSESCDFHDLVKTLLVRMLRQNYKDSRMTVIYTEFNATEPNADYPDIWMRMNRYSKRRQNSAEIYVWELQEVVTDKWLKQIQEKHSDVTLIIVPLKKVREKWRDGLMNNLQTNKTLDPVKDLRVILEEYVI